MAHREVDDLMRIARCLRLFWFRLVFYLSVWGCHQEFFEGIGVVVGLCTNAFLQIHQVLFFVFLIFQICLTSCNRRRCFHGRATRVNRSRLRTLNGRSESALLLLFLKLDLVRIFVLSFVFDHVLIHGPIGEASLGLFYDF